MLYWILEVYKNLEVYERLNAICSNNLTDYRNYNNYFIRFKAQKLTKFRFLPNGKPFKLFLVNDKRAKIDNGIFDRKFWQDSDRNKPHSAGYE